MVQADQTGSLKDEVKPEKSESKETHKQNPEQEGSKPEKISPVVSDESI